jgi:preprotein translocase subunit SecF
MKSINKKILIAFSILIIVIIVGFLFYSTLHLNEGFSTTTGTPVGTPSSPELTATPMKEVEENKEHEKSKPQKDDVSTHKSENNLLSDKEQTLFDDLLSNKLTDVNIQSLINSGFLTENMIERFLSKLTNTNTNETFVGANLVADVNYIDKNKNPLELINTESDEFELPNSIFEGFDVNTPIYAKYY